jgi:hypothetical protein
MVAHIGQNKSKTQNKEKFMSQRWHNHACKKSKNIPKTVHHKTHNSISISRQSIVYFIPARGNKINIPFTTVTTAATKKN